LSGQAFTVAGKVGLVATGLDEWARWPEQYCPLCCNSAPRINLLRAPGKPTIHANFSCSRTPAQHVRYGTFAICVI